jgi:O-antigen/teichoic acid export membrane protein
MGFGIATFTIAVLARSVTGLLFTYLIQNWSIGFDFDLKAFKRLISYGIPFQANSILALIKDDLLTIYLGKILPYSQLGYVGFSQKWAFMPIRLIMDNAIKITFPSYSRLQNDTQALKVALEKSLFFVSTFMFPAAVGMILYSSYFIQYFPRYTKWEPAIMSLMFFSLNSIFSSVSTPLTNFLNAIGKVKITLYFMIFWTAATWISTITLVTIYGYNGVGAASFIVSISSVAVVFVSRRYVKFSILKPIIRQLLAALIMGLFVFITQSFVVNLAMLFLFIVLSAGIYFLILYLLAYEDIRQAIVYIIRTIRSKR